MSGYIGSRASVVSSGAERKKTYSITGTTTSLTGLSYTVNQVHVFHNGVRLVDGTDFTATNGSSITLTSAAESGDEVVVVSYATFQAADAYTKAEADAEFVNDPNSVISVSGSNIGIGTSSPSQELDVVGSIRASTFFQGGADGTASAPLYRLNDANTGFFRPANNEIGFTTNGSEAMRISSNGQVGIAHTPNSSTSGDTKNLFVGGLTTIRGTNGTSGKQNFHTGIQYNAYPTGSVSDTALVSSSSDDFKPVKYVQSNGLHRFYGTSSATAGSNISWDEYMRIDSAGRVTMPYQPAFVAYNAPAYLTNNVNIIWSSTVLNRGSVYNTSNGRFTAPVAGLYQFFASVRIESNEPAATYHRVSFRHNGSDVQWSKSRLNSRTATGYYSHAASDQLIGCQAGDYVEVKFESGGVSQFTSSANGEHVFYGYLIG